MGAFTASAGSSGVRASGTSGMVQNRQNVPDGFRKSQPNFMAQSMKGGEVASMGGSYNNRRSMQLEPGALGKIDTGEAPKKRFLEQAASNLPIKFDLTAVKRSPSEACMLCQAAFTKKFALGKNPIRHCKRCGKSICQVCSEGRRRLSRTDPELHRVCDMCDTEMDNFKLKQNHEEVLTAQMEKIEVLNNQIEQLDNDKQKLHEDYEQEAQSLQQTLKEKYDKRDELNTQVKNLNNDIAHMNTARNYLHESISDLEKVIGDLEVEQRRLQTKQETVLTQIMESEYALKERNMLNEEQTQKLEKLKKKVSKGHHQEH